MPSKALEISLFFFFCSGPSSNFFCSITGENSTNQNQNMVEPFFWGSILVLILCSYTVEAVFERGCYIPSLDHITGDYSSNHNHNMVYKHGRIHGFWVHRGF